MTRIFARVAIVISLLMLLAACGPSSPDGETANQESPTAPPLETVEVDMAALIMELTNQGGPVGAGDDIKQPFFLVAGQTLIVKRRVLAGVQL